MNEQVKNLMHYYNYFAWNLQNQWGERKVEMIILVIEMEDLTKRMIGRLVPGDPAGTRKLIENVIFFSQSSIFLSESSCRLLPSFSFPSPNEVHMSYRFLFAH